MPIDQETLDSIPDALRKLRATPLDQFGSRAHKFRLNPKLPESKIQEFEHVHGITLPEDYRYFLKYIGNGGAGPYYGIFDLGYTKGGSIWTKENDETGLLAQPFPYTEEWNDTSSYSDLDTEIDKETRSRLFAEFEAVYCAPRDGAIPISNFGCGIYILLIVSGPEKGNIWMNDTPHDNGFIPLTDKNHQHLTFTEWYKEWMLELLGNLPEPSLLTKIRKWFHKT